MQIEVVYGTVTQQTLLSCEVYENTTVREAILKSGILEYYPELDLDSLTVGIFSKKVKLSATLKAGDRVEIYRPLIIDPKEARRLRSKTQKALK